MRTNTMFNLRTVQFIRLRPETRKRTLWLPPKLQNPGAGAAVGVEVRPHLPQSKKELVKGNLPHSLPPNPMLLHPHANPHALPLAWKLSPMTTKHMDPKPPPTPATP